MVRVVERDAEDLGLHRELEVDVRQPLVAEASADHLDVLRRTKAKQKTFHGTMGSLKWLIGRRCPERKLFSCLCTSLTEIKLAGTTIKKIG